MGRPPDATREVLDLFAANPRITVAELAHATNRDETAMRKRLSLMARDGHLTAHRAHPTALAIYTLPGVELPSEAPTLTDRVLAYVQSEPCATLEDLTADLRAPRRAVRTALDVLCGRGVLRTQGPCYLAVG